MNCNQSYNNSHLADSQNRHFWGDPSYPETVSFEVVMVTQPSSTTSHCLQAFQGENLWCSGIRYTTYTCARSAALKTQNCQSLEKRSSPPCDASNSSKWWIIEALSKCPGKFMPRISWRHSGNEAGEISNSSGCCEGWYGSSYWDPLNPNKKSLKSWWWLFLGRGIART